jgi:hypothetical protein
MIIIYYLYAVGFVLHLQGRLEVRHPTVKPYLNIFCPIHNLDNLPPVSETRGVTRMVFQKIYLQWNHHLMFALMTRFLYLKSRNFLHGGYVNFKQNSTVHFKCL